MPAELPIRGSCRCWYSQNHAAMLTPLTSVSIAHQRPTGFDQARDLGRDDHSKLMTAPHVTELTFDRINSVTKRGEVTAKDRHNRRLPQLSPQLADLLLQQPPGLGAELL